MVIGVTKAALPWYDFCLLGSFRKKWLNKNSFENHYFCTFQIPLELHWQRGSNGIWNVQNYWCSDVQIFFTLSKTVFMPKTCFCRTMTMHLYPYKAKHQKLDMLFNTVCPLVLALFGTHTLGKIMGKFCNFPKVFPLFSQKWAKWHFLGKNTKISPNILTFFSSVQVL